MGILRFQPNRIVGLSLASVWPIVAAYEVMALRRRTKDEPAYAWLGKLRPAANYVGGILGASLIATLATAPLALAHFQQAPLYGLAANLAAMPLMAFVIMPAAIVAGIAALFGLADLPLQVMALGIDAVVGVAHIVSSWPGGVIRVPGSSGWIVAAFLIGGVLICALRGWFRAFGLIGVLAAAIGLALTLPPDILVSGQGRLAALIKDDKLLATSLRAGRFERDVWKRYTAAKSTQALGGTVGQCDDKGCVAKLKGYGIAMSLAADGVAEDCCRVDILLALHGQRVTKAMGCGADLTVIDAWMLRQKGAYAIWLDPTGPQIQTVRGVQGPRLWSGWRRP